MANHLSMQIFTGHNIHFVLNLWGSLRIRLIHTLNTSFKPGTGRTEGHYENSNIDKIRRPWGRSVRTFWKGGEFEGGLQGPSQTFVWSFSNEKWREMPRSYEIVPNPTKKWRKSAENVPFCTDIHSKMESDFGAKYVFFRVEFSR